MSNKKYVSLNRLSFFFDNLKSIFVTKTDIETKQDIITGTAGQFVVIGDDGNIATKTILNAEDVMF